MRNKQINQITVLKYMKIIVIIFSILLIAFIAVQVYFMSSQKDIESYAYTVEKKYDKFEVRNYEPSLFSSVKLDSDAYEESSSKGFRILAGYIFGGNDKEENIAMTSPVSMSLEKDMTMMFMVPKKFNRETLPTPNQSNIEFVEMPARKLAAITFGGWANNEKIEEYKQKLIAALAAEGITHGNKFFYFGYNAPMEVFNRRNEVLIELGM